MTEPFTIDASSLVAWQSCRRKYLLHSDFIVSKWRPHSLFDWCLRRGIVALSSGKDLNEVSTAARADLMSMAANPGLDIAPGGSPYQIAKDLCAMLSTILCSLSRLTLLKVSPAPPVSLTPAVTWKVTSLADDSSALHRWITVASLDDDTLARELHGWHVAGDICATRLPLTLHIILIGQQRNGRRGSPWARGWRHPSIPGSRTRFRKLDGSALKKTFEPVYLADEPAHDTPKVIAEWVNAMEREGVPETLIHHIPVDVPSDAACEDTVAQMASEAAAMRVARMEIRSSPYFAYPMSRNACDGFSPCAWQPCCYSSRVIDPASLPLYQVRKPDKVPA